MKNTIYTLLTAGAICTNAWAAGSQSWHVYDITNPIDVTNHWDVRASVNLELDTKKDPFTIFAMGEEVGLEKIDNNFELLFNPGDGTFKLNYCTENGTNSNTWDIPGSISEDGIYAVYLQGNAYGMTGWLELIVNPGDDIGGAGEGDNFAIHEWYFGADFTFKEGTTIDTISSQADIIEMKGAELRAVPEPTTATLSLLALAGLVARRRRK